MHQGKMCHRYIRLTIYIPIFSMIFSSLDPIYGHWFSMSFNDFNQCCKGACIRCVPRAAQSAALGTQREADPHMKQAFDSKTVKFEAWFPASYATMKHFPKPRDATVIAKLAPCALRQAPSPLKRGSKVIFRFFRFSIFW